jgi:type II secretory pathway component PulM
MALFQDQIDRLTDQLERLSPRDRMLVFIMFVAGLLLITYLTSLLIGQSIETADANNRELEIRLEDINQIQGQFEQARQKVREIEQRIASNNVELVRFLGDLSSQHKIDIHSMSPATVESRTPQKQQSKVREESVQIEMRGATLATLARFLDAIENSGHIIKVRRLRLTPNFNKPENVDVTATISTYGLK